jgi:hypothetical protein
MNRSSPVTVTRSPDRLKKAIHDTLAELSELESNQTKMDAYHEVRCILCAMNPGN